jgi:proteasome activator subunit 4
LSVRLVIYVSSLPYVDRCLSGSYLHAVRSAWNGLPTIILEGHKEVVNPCIIEDSELPELLAVPLTVEAGYTLTDENDPRYQTVMAHRRQFGNVLHQASVALRESGAEDHIDAILAISRAIDVYLLEYGVTANAFSTLNKSYVVVREWVLSSSPSYF